MKEWDEICEAPNLTSSSPGHHYSEENSSGIGTDAEAKAEKTSAKQFVRCATIRVARHTLLD